MKENTLTEWELLFDDIEEFEVMEEQKNRTSKKEELIIGFMKEIGFRRSQIKIFELLLKVANGGLQIVTSLRELAIAHYGDDSGDFFQKKQNLNRSLKRFEAKQKEKNFYFVRRSRTAYAGRDEFGQFLSHTITIEFPILIKWKEIQESFSAKTEEEIIDQIRKSHQRNLWD